jgi:hypothetical protein
MVGSDQDNNLGYDEVWDASLARPVLSILEPTFRAVGVPTTEIRLAAADYGRRKPFKG